MTLPQTPHYLIDMALLRANMDKVAQLREASGAKALLALKCFATWSVFDLMRDYMDGTTSSSLYELRLGRETSARKPMPIPWLGPITRSTGRCPMPTRSSSTASRSWTATAPERRASPPGCG